MRSSTWDRNVEHHISTPTDTQDRTRRLPAGYGPDVTSATDLPLYSRASQHHDVALRTWSRMEAANAKLAPRPEAIHSQGVGIGEAAFRH